MWRDSLKVKDDAGSNKQKQGAAWDSDGDESDEEQDEACVKTQKKKRKKNQLKKIGRKKC